MESTSPSDNGAGEISVELSGSELSGSCMVLELSGSTGMCDISASGAGVLGVNSPGIIGVVDSVASVSVGMALDVDVSHVSSTKTSSSISLLNLELITKSSQHGGGLIGS